MARGGYVSVDIAIDKLFKAIGDREKAKTLIVEALRSNALRARGQPQIPAEPLPSHDEDGNMILRSIGFSPDPPILADQEDIPSRFWKSADLSREFFWASIMPSEDEEITYYNLVLREQDLNELLKLRQPDQAGKAPKERARRADWNEWVAALVSLAHEHRIDGHKSQNILLAEISDKLGEWGLAADGGLPASTVNPVLRTVLGRLKSNPPGTPRTPKPQSL